MRLRLSILALTLAACGVRRSMVSVDGNPASGEQSISRLGCGTCHTIPGVPGAHGKVGPSLAGLALRGYIAGRLTNQPENLRLWIQHPRTVDSATLMPELGLSDTESRNIVAYLYSLD